MQGGILKRVALRILGLGLGLVGLGTNPLSLAAPDGQLSIEVSVIVEGSNEWDLTQARTAYVPGEPSIAVTTCSQTVRVGAHGYHDVYLTVSRDAGISWSELKSIPSLRRFERDDGYEAVPGDLWPQYHPGSGKILVTGKVFQFEDGTREDILREQIAYATIDPDTLACGPMKVLELTGTDGAEIISPNAGCHQWVALPNGDVILPVRYQKSADSRNYTSTVLRCSFDGDKLEILARGSEHNIATKRGLYEPSVTRFGDEFFLTLRADDGAWVAKSSDGLHFSPHKPWTFDDGKPLGSYNTQQHFAELAGKLYLIYTRRGAGNDHIMRHRAPLFIARIDTRALTIVRDTEQILALASRASRLLCLLLRRISLRRACWHSPSSFMR